MLCDFVILLVRMRKEPRAAPDKKIMREKFFLTLDKLTAQKKTGKLKNITPYQDLDAYKKICVPRSKKGVGVVNYYLLFFLLLVVAVALSCSLACSKCLFAAL